MSYLITICTNQFFLMFLTVACGLIIGKIKIGNFSLGVSGGIFSGIIIGYFVTRWAQGIQEGEAAYQTAAGILKNGVVTNIFFIFFLLLFLLSIGLKVGGSIGTIFKKYGFKFVVIGVSIPLISMLMAVILQFVVLGNSDVTEHETAGMFAGAMTSTPGYGTALDASNAIDYKTMYTEGENKQKEEMLKIIDPSGELTVENTTENTQEENNKTIEKTDTNKTENVEEITKNQKYKITHRKEVYEKNKLYTERVDKAIKIIEEYSEKDYIITMEIEGKELSSIEFARKIDEIQINNSNICFIIGGSYGLHKEIKNLSNFKLSFSKLKFVAIILLVLLIDGINSVNGVVILKFIYIF